MALTHRPTVLSLDEPATGRDPGSRAGPWDLARRLRDEHGTTVFLTTNHLDEADALPGRLVIVDVGVAAEGTPSALKPRHGGSPGASPRDTSLAVTGRGTDPAGQPPVAALGPGRLDSLSHLMPFRSWSTPSGTPASADARPSTCCTASRWRSGSRPGP